jgi:hypothetical protein
MKNVIVTQGERVSTRARRLASPVIGATLLALIAALAACGGRVMSTAGVGGDDSAEAVDGGGTWSDAGAYHGDDGSVGAGLDATGSPLGYACSGGPAGGVNPSGVGCSVSFTRDLLATKMGAVGAWGCASIGCHDPQSGVSPRIDVQDPLSTYANLYNSGSGPKPYINPCSELLEDSEIFYNLSSAPLYMNHMPMDNPDLPSAADLELVRSWVMCGSPMN